MAVEKRGKSPVSGRYSIMTEEIGYVHNNVLFYDKSEGDYEGRQAFPDLLVDSLTKLSIHIAIYFESNDDGKTDSDSLNDSDDGNEDSESDDDDDETDHDESKTDIE